MECLQNRNIQTIFNDKMKYIFKDIAFWQKKNCLHFAARLKQLQNIHRRAHSFQPYTHSRPMTNLRTLSIHGAFKCKIKGHFLSSAHREVACAIRLMLIKVRTLFNANV